MINATTRAASAPDTPSSSDSSSSPVTKDALGDRNTFLKLLVAQLKYQNPLNPADGVQFVTQLAQFSSLEQTMQVSQDMSAIRKILEANFPAAATGSDQQQTTQA